MEHIHSSWNSDRIAASLLNKSRKTPGKWETPLIAVFKGKDLKVVTGRGAVRFAADYRDTIASACCLDGWLRVVLADGSVFTYGYDTADGTFRAVRAPPRGRGRHKPREYADVSTKEL